MAGIFIFNFRWDLSSLWKSMYSATDALNSSCVWYPLRYTCFLKFKKAFYTVLSWGCTDVENDCSTYVGLFFAEFQVEFDIVNISWQYHKKKKVKPQELASLRLCLWWPFLLAASERAARWNVKEKSLNANCVQTLLGRGGHFRYRLRLS